MDYGRHQARCSLLNDSYSSCTMVNSVTFSCLSMFSEYKLVWLFLS